MVVLGIGGCCADTHRRCERWGKRCLDNGRSNSHTVFVFIRKSEKGDISNIDREDGIESSTYGQRRGISKESAEHERYDRCRTTPIE